MSPLRVECCRAATTVIIAGGRIGCRVGEGGPPAGSEVMDPEPGLPNGSSPEPRRRAEAPYRQRAGVEKPEQTTAYGRPAKTHEGRLAAVDKASETSGRTEKKKKEKEKPSVRVG